jgi:hypothetical protein
MDKTRRYYVSKDYSDFVGPKHKSILALFLISKHFWSVLLWQTLLKFICLASSSVEIISTLHTEKISRNWRLQENMESCQNLFLVRPHFSPPSPPPIHLKSAIKAPFSGFPPFYPFIGPICGRNFVHSLHLKWVPMFLAIFFLLLNSHVRMYVGCTVKYSFRSFSGSSNLSPKLRWWWWDL